MHNLTKIKIFRVALWVTWPLALLFVLPFAYWRKKSPTGLFFFFDRYVVGGAQRIHLDLLKSVEATPKDIFFTRYSANDAFKEAFWQTGNSRCADIHIWCDYLLFRLFTVHYFAFWLNRHPKSTILSANSTFFYDMLPFLSSRIKRIELLHNFTFGKKGFEFFGLANARFLDYRIVYDSFTLSNLKKQYDEYRVPPVFQQRILFIEPGVDLPAAMPEKEYGLPLKVLYAGRGGTQKRVWLLNRIVEYFIENRLPVVFHFAGSMEAELSDTVKQHSVIHGAVKGKEKMDSIYSDSHAIILTSAYEGFPMVIKEGMSMGCIPVVTALEGNKMHLTDGQNAVLIDAVTDEEAVVRLGIEAVKRLMNDQALVKHLSVSAYRYASIHFTKEKFMQAYRNLLKTGAE